MISDATGETLIAVARAAVAQYANVQAIEHIFPLVRSKKQLDRAIADLESSPGIVLYTLVNPEISAHLEEKCRALGLPCVSVLGPVLDVYRSYLGQETTHRVGGQHILDADYFRRIDALNYTIMHDDGQHPEGLGHADIILVGISRTSKTPTSMYLANRGIKAANVPLVLGIPLPFEPEEIDGPLIVSLIATPERIIQVRKNRLLSLNADKGSDYVDRRAITDEIAESRRLSAKHNWPVIDVSRRSIEETAAAIIALYQKHKPK